MSDCDNFVEQKVVFFRPQIFWNLNLLSITRNKVSELVKYWIWHLESGRAW